MENQTDFGFEKVSRQEKTARVKQVFNSVASNYDLMNDLMSLGAHRLWKRYAINACQLRPGQQVLDLAAGTGDLSLLIAPAVTPAGGQVTLCDINGAMLAIARNRLIDAGYVNNTPIVQANAEALPFASNHFDRMIMSFGLRNVTVKENALKSLYRVLKPGGRLIILEFSHPKPGFFSTIYDAYSFHLLPFLGKHVAKDPDSYRYLAESIRMHPNQASLRDMILNAGFDQCDYDNLSGGIVAVHKATKY